MPYVKSYNDRNMDYRKNMNSIKSVNDIAV